MLSLLFILILYRKFIEKSKFEWRFPGFFKAPEFLEKFLRKFWRIFWKILDKKKFPEKIKFANCRNLALVPFLPISIPYPWKIDGTVCPQHRIYGIV